MRLLLDEQLSPVIAEALRQRGHDVISVADAGLRARADPEVLAWAMSERRAVATANVDDLRRLHQVRVEGGDRTFGFVLISARNRPRSRAAFGKLIAALDSMLKERPADDALACLEHWL